MRLCVSTGLACTQHGRVVLVYRFAAWLPDPMTSCAAPSLDDSTPCLTRQRLRPTPWTGFGLRYLCESLRRVLRTVMAGRHAISLRCSIQAKAATYRCKTHNAATVKQPDSQKRSAIFSSAVISNLCFHGFSVRLEITESSRSFWLRAFG
jgi:hypothetical protein